ncbi:MAG: hypothetical protein ACLGSD_14455 [Acidobacteriota bacterium]
MAHSGTVPNAKDRRRNSQAKPLPRGSKRAEEVEYDDEMDDEVDEKPGFLQYCWPAIFGIILAVIAPQIWDKVSHDYGKTGIRWVFPFVKLLGRPELGLSPQLTQALPQLFVYLQFPLEGLLISFFISRGTKYGRAIIQIGFVHFIAAFVLWLLSKPGATHGL